MPPRNNKQKRTNNKKKGKNGGKTSVSRAAAAVAIQNTDLVCYHGCTVEKSNDPNIHKVLDAYLEFGKEYGQFLQSDPDGETKYDTYCRLRSAFYQEHEEILKDPEFATYMFGSALNDYIRSKKMVNGDTVRSIRVKETVELGLYLRYKFIPRSKGEYMDTGSQLYENFIKYSRDIAFGNIRGLINVLARETPCDCMKVDYNDAKEEAKITGKLGKCCHCEKDVPKETLLECTKCKRARYCSAKCQKEHWSSHRKVCEIIHKGELMNRLRISRKKIEEYKKDNPKEAPDYSELLGLAYDLKIIDFNEETGNVVIN